MKKLQTIVFVLITFLMCNLAISQTDVENTAKDILKAYKEKDVALLKKHASGVIVYAINDNFFDSNDAKPAVEKATGWDGKIKEIRYASENMMGKEVVMACVYFGDSNTGKLNVVLLSNLDNTEWKAFALGIDEVSKEEFEKMSLEIPKKGEEKAEAKKEAGHSEFSIEMASGDTFQKPTTDKLKELLKSLNDDNFFIILNGKSGFLQASTSEKGYIIQYSDDSGMFEAEAYFTEAMMIDIFVVYIDKGNWKEKAKWVEM